jgi:hypothetical protein
MPDLSKKGHEIVAPLLMQIYEKNGAVSEGLEKLSQIRSKSGKSGGRPKKKIVEPGAGSDTESKKSIQIQIINHLLYLNKYL